MARATTEYAGARSVTTSRNAREVHVAMDRRTRAIRALASSFRILIDSW
jgi:hypothetical protein